MKALQQRLQMAEACYERNLRQADAWRGTGNSRIVRRYERAAESAWSRVDSLRYKLSRPEQFA